MELRNVVTFLRVAEMENFTRAAETLGYSQSTVTVQIRQLEEELGYQLFDRVGKRISLTSRGQEFLIYANQLSAISQQIKLIPSQEPASLHGSLRLGILESLFLHIFLPQLPAYHQQFPHITLQTKTESSEELFSLLRHNELDIIFTLGPRRSERDCVRAYEKETDIRFVAAANSPYALHRPLRFGEICRMPLILTERSSIYRRELEYAAAQRDLELTPMLEVDSTSAIISLVKLGMGVSLLPSYVIQSPLQHGELVALEVEDCAFRLWQQVFYHKNKWVTPQMSGFISLLQQSDAD